MANGQNIVVDNGSGTIKAGLSGQTSPSVVFPTVVGRFGGGAASGRSLEMESLSDHTFDNMSRSDVSESNAMFTDPSPGAVGSGKGQVSVGDVAIAMRGMIDLVYPIEKGVISPHHQTEIEAIWNYTFDNKLRVDPSEYNVLFTEPPNNPKDAREAIIRYAFETRQVAGAYIGLQPMLALYASGRTTGIVVDSGFGVTHVTPIFEGVVQKIGISRLELAGRDLTNLTAQLLRLQPEKDFYLAQTIKEETCYVKSSPDSDAPDTINYTLPDGSTIAVNESRDLVPEALFEPPATQPDILGIPAIIDKSISECDLSIQLALLSNIVLSGGSTLFPGFAERLEYEARDIRIDGKVDIIATPERKFATWIGGSMLTELSTFKNAWITKSDYEEHGPSIAHIKCE